MSAVNYDIFPLCLQYRMSLPQLSLYAQSVVKISLYYARIQHRISLVSKGRKIAAASAPAASTSSTLECLRSLRYFNNQLFPQLVIVSCNSFSFLFCFYYCRVV